MQLYQRRMRICKKKEKKFWLMISDKYMSQEESDEDSDVLAKSKPAWQSEGSCHFLTFKIYDGNHVSSHSSSAFD